MAQIDIKDNTVLPADRVVGEGGKRRGEVRKGLRAPWPAGAVHHCI